jgi:hypothetical protein
MRKLAMLAGALAVGYVAGAMGLLIWAGYHLYEDIESGSFSWDDLEAQF